MSVSADAAGRSITTGTLSLPWIIAASSVGTLIEWYDFYIYGTLAVFFAKHFFPPGNDNLALLASLAVFWFGFILRPFGAIFFGHLGDLIGRKFTSMLTLVLLSGYIRLRLEESPLYARLKEEGKASTNPIRDTYTSGRNWGLMAIALFGATAPEGVVWYTGQFYALIYLTAVLKLNYVTVYIIMMVALTIGSLGFIFFGWWSDRIGRRGIMTWGFALAVVTYWPVFTWLGTFRDNPVVLTLLVLYLV